MRWALIVGGSVGILIAAVLVIGLLLPRDHVSTMTARIGAAPAAVWSTITDPAGFPAWRRDVTRVELLPPTSTGPSWREFSRHGALTMVVMSADAPHRLVTRIADTGLPYGGTWEFVVTPHGDSASRVTITERGSVYNPVFRFVSRFVMGHTATIEAYLRQLGAHFGDRHGL